MMEDLVPPLGVLIIVMSVNTLTADGNTEGKIYTLSLYRNPKMAGI